MPGEMVERVARRLWHLKYGTNWDDYHEDARAEFRQQARAAIEVMREPSEAMMTAHLDAEDQLDWRSQARNDWQAMIDEALQ